MKTIRILFVLLFISGQLFAQKGEEKAFESITKAVTSGLAVDLSAYFAPSIECDILGKDNVYSKAQTIQVMKDFFARYKAKSFTTLHQSGKGQVKYIIGTYATTSGETFRITFFVKQEGADSFLIQQIRIENANTDAQKQ